MNRKPEAELQALLPPTVTPAPLAESLRHLDDATPAFPTPEATELAARLSRLAVRHRQRHRFSCLPAGTKNVNCENKGHTLMFRLLPSGECEFFDGDLAMNGAIGPMPAEFAYFEPPWPPRPGGKRGDTDTHFVCGFCAAALSECWAEGEAEARMS